VRELGAVRVDGPQAEGVRMSRQYREGTPDEVIGPPGHLGAAAQPEGAVGRDALQLDPQSRDVDELRVLPHEPGENRAGSPVAVARRGEGSEQVHPYTGDPAEESRLAETAKEPP